MEGVVLTQSLKQRIDYFHVKALRNIMRVESAYMSKISNKKILDKANEILYGKSETSGSSSRKEYPAASKQIQQRINTITTHNINSLVIRSKSQYRIFFPTGTAQTENAAQGLLAVIKANPNTEQLGFEYADMNLTSWVIEPY